MMNKLSKSNEKLNTVEELALMRISIRIMRDQLNESLNSMLDRINRLIPAEDSNRSKKYKNFGKKDWKKYLGF